MRRAIALCVLVLGPAALAGCGSDDDDEGDRARGAPAADVRLVEVGGFEAPIFVTAPPCDRSRTAVVEQGGTVYRLAAR